MSRNTQASSPAVKSLENVFLRIRRDWPAGVADEKHNVIRLALSLNSHSTAGAVVFARVLQNVLHNQRGVTLFTRNVQFRWKTLLNLHIGRVGKRSEIIQPFFNELTQIHWFGVNFDMTSVHPGQQQQIVDNSSQSIGLMKKPGKLVVDFRFEILTAEQTLESGAQNGDW